MPKRDERLSPIDVESQFKEEIYKLAHRRGYSVAGLVRFSLKQEVEKDKKRNPEYYNSTN